MNLKEKMKVVGKIDLDSINQKLHPTKKTKEEKDALRKEKEEEAKQHNRELLIADARKKVEGLKAKFDKAVDELASMEIVMEEKRQTTSDVIKQQEEWALQLEYLQRRAAVREKYQPSPMNNGVLLVSNNVRQKELRFNGIRPQRMDIVHFHVAKSKKQEEMDGVALVKDENHYYFAVDMYDHTDREDNMTTMMDENPDGTFDGIWPANVTLGKAQKFEERYMRQLTDKYADELDAAEAYIKEKAEKERKEMEELEAKMSTDKNTLLKELNIGEAALNAARADLRLMQQDLDKAEEELRRMERGEEKPVSSSEEVEEEKEEFVYNFDKETNMEVRCPHLPYLRGKVEMLTMEWPFIETDMHPHLRFRLMGNIARLMMYLRKGHALTYLLSGEYIKELQSRAARSYKGMTPDDVVADGVRTEGIIVYPNQGFEDTILYTISRQGPLTMMIGYIRERRLMFYESFSVQEILGHPRVDNFICQSLRESGTEPNRLFAYLRNFVVAFLAMERDMERTVNRLVDEGIGETEEKDINEDDAIDTTDDKDVVIRDASWYTDITVNREIPVRGYLSHRWCGKGKDKHLCEVWVRPHERNGYHRAAGVSKG